MLWLPIITLFIFSILVFLSKKQQSIALREFLHAPGLYCLDFLKTKGLPLQYTYQHLRTWAYLFFSIQHEMDVIKFRNNIMVCGCTTKLTLIYGVIKLNYRIRLEY